MTTYDEKVLRCYCCGRTSEHAILMSTNSFGSPDLDQRSAGMERDTIHTWLQECPFCGYVAFDIESGEARAKDFVKTAEFRAASSDPAPDPVERRFLVRAAFEVYRGDRRGAFLNTLSAAWVADDRKQSSQATALRLRAAAHLEGRPIKSIDTRLLLLDVLRRASSWEAADALAAELIAEELEYPLAKVVSFHRERIEARDDGRYTIAQVVAYKPQPRAATEDPELIKAIARHIKIIPKSGKT